MQRVFAYSYTYKHTLFVYLHAACICTHVYAYMWALKVKCDQSAKRGFGLSGWRISRSSQTSLWQWDATLERRLLDVEWDVAKKDLGKISMLDPQVLFRWQVTPCEIIRISWEWGLPGKGGTAVLRSCNVDPISSPHSEKHLIHKAQKQKAPAETHVHSPILQRDASTPSIPNTLEHCP